VSLGESTCYLKGTVTGKTRVYKEHIGKDAAVKQSERKSCRGRPTGKPGVRTGSWTYQQHDGKYRGSGSGGPAVQGKVLEKG